MDKNRRGTFGAAPVFISLTHFLWYSNGLKESAKPTWLYHREVMC
jgi:hypothetical protein